MSTYGKEEKEAKRIYDSYMNGLIGVQKYQKFRRRDWFDKGYILLNTLGYKAYIYDWEDLKRYKAEMSQDGFWEDYKFLKACCPEDRKVQIVRIFFKRKAASEKQSINYPIQSSGAMCIKIAMSNFFNWLRREKLLFKVLLCILPYDEANIEAPAKIANLVSEKLDYYMRKAGDLFCDKCKLTTDLSTLDNGELPNYWIH